jgi:hypothetical protein
MVIKRLFQSKYRSWKGGILGASIIGCGNGVKAPFSTRQRYVENVPYSPYAYQRVIVYNTSVQPQSND